MEKSSTRTRIVASDVVKYTVSFLPHNDGHHNKGHTEIIANLLDSTVNHAHTAGLMIPQCLSDRLNVTLVKKSFVGLRTTKDQYREHYNSFKEDYTNSGGSTSYVNGNVVMYIYGRRNLNVGIMGHEFMHAIQYGNWLEERTDSRPKSDMLTEIPAYMFGGYCKTGPDVSGIGDFVKGVFEFKNTPVGGTELARYSSVMSKLYKSLKEYDNETFKLCSELRKSEDHNLPPEINKESSRISKQLDELPSAKIRSLFFDQQENVRSIGDIAGTLGVLQFALSDLDIKKALNSVLSAGSNEDKFIENFCALIRDSDYDKTMDRLRFE